MNATSKGQPLQLVWLRNDLRATDNSALWSASQKGPVVCLYLITPGQWKKHHLAPIKADFIGRSLHALERELSELNIPLWIRAADSFANAPDLITDCMRQLGAESLHCNREYLINEVRRDAAVSACLSSCRLNFYSYHDALIVPPGEVRTAEGNYYKVFTPFRRAWEKQVLESPPEILPRPQPQSSLELPTLSSSVDITNYPTRDSRHWDAGEAAAQRRLRHFLNEAVHDYKTNRDRAELDGTSRISHWLSLGTLSARQALLPALQQIAGELDSAGPGLRQWISELVWREFYFHLIDANPRLCMGEPFQLDTRTIHWRDSAKDVQAWKTGTTGQPLVDAGMRQLAQEGWMHNRLRMITAMFLTKNLFIDWHLGETFFMQNLIDGDFALNNGGWQWSASTGTDAAPYFRVFNPFSQSARFDPDATYIKRYVPELAQVPAAALHDERKLALVRPANYPSLIVDMKKSRQQAIEIFARMKKAPH